MAETTGIAWAHHTWSPWVGCTKLNSPDPAGSACDYCYAAALAKRTGLARLWEGERRRTSDGYWRQLRRWNRRAREAGERRRVFPSMCDPFDNRANPEWRRAMWETIDECRDLDFLLLTKRPTNIPAMLPPGWAEGWPNVWLGATVENQTEADRRIVALLDVPARLRFLSVEPLLGSLEIGPGLTMHRDQWGNWRQGGGIHWVIVGGESGPHARPMDPTWARDIISECRRFNVPVFFKQIGSDRTGWPGTITRNGDTPAEWPAEIHVQQFPSFAPRAG